MKIIAKVRNDLKDRFRLVSKEYRKKTADMVTRAAVNVRRAEISAMDRQLDRPTPFTRKGVLFKAATENTLTAVVYIRPVQASYLIYQVKGGTSDKPTPAPSTVSENKYGNLPKGATKRKRTFTIKSKRTGKRHVVRRVSKKKTVLVATWSTRRHYRKGRYNFYGVAAKTAQKYLKDLK